MVTEYTSDCRSAAFPEVGSMPEQREIRGSLEGGEDTFSGPREGGLDASDTRGALLRIPRERPGEKEQGQRNDWCVLSEVLPFWVKEMVVRG